MKLLRSGRTIYAINEQGFNRFSALVQDAWTSEKELEEIAQRIVELWNAQAEEKPENNDRYFINTHGFADAQCAIFRKGSFISLDEYGNESHCGAYKITDVEEYVNRGIWLEFQPRGE